MERTKIIIGLCFLMLTNDSYSGLSDVSLKQVTVFLGAAVAVYIGYKYSFQEKPKLQYFQHYQYAEKPNAEKPKLDWKTRQLLKRKLFKEKIKNAIKLETIKEEN